jgi:hypothetical protein
MGYLEAPLSLNPSDREPKTTIVTRVMLGAELVQKEGWMPGPLAAGPFSFAERSKARFRYEALESL